MWIGQTWDGPALSLKKEGKPVNYQAPKEGAIAWVDGLVADQGGQERRPGLCVPRTTCTRRKPRRPSAEGSGYNPVITGADALLSDVAKKNFQEAFPGDALKNLWPGRRNRPGMRKSAASMPTSSRPPDRAASRIADASPGSPGLVCF